MPVLRIVSQIAAPPDVCFDLSRSIDLHLESMAASRERAVGGVTSGLIRLGEHVTWEARHFGGLWRMTSQITQFDPPRIFVDEMIEGGPFARFRHEHRFEPDGDTTRMTDVVDFKTRWRVVRPLTDFVVGRYVRRLMRIRNEALRKAAGKR